MSLPLQLSLLALADSNSEALMQQQLLDVWSSKGQQAFAGQPWMWTNYLVYRLYHETFPRHEQHDMLTCYLQLVSDYFLLRSLFSLWLMDGSPSALPRPSACSAFSKAGVLIRKPPPGARRCCRITTIPCWRRSPCWSVNTLCHITRQNPVLLARCWITPRHVVLARYLLSAW